MTNEIVRYNLDNGQNIEVTEQDVRDLLSASGQIADNVTAQEIKTFMRLCQAQRLNPFTKDAYIVKYGNKPATIITGKEAFTKRAFRNAKFRGMEAGITVIGTDKKLHRRDGSLLLKGEELVGGWCRVFLDGYERPMFEEVSVAEYSTGTNNWAKIPATMIRKVAITHALREAFPEDLGGLYGEEEMAQAQEEPTYETPQQPQTVEAEVVNVEPSQPAQDPRKTLWAEAAKLKAQAIELGANENGINAWMAAAIVNQDGTPKPKNCYTPENILELIEHLETNIGDLKTLKNEQVNANLAPENVPETSAEILEGEYIEPDYTSEDIVF